MEEYKGALLDTRPEELKAKDFKNTNPELASAVPLKWAEKKPEQWKNYPSRDQLQTSSCVAQAIAKAYFVLYQKIVSAHPTYRLRKNFAEKGMWLYDGGDIAKKIGTVDESIDVSQGLSESQINADLNDEVKDILLHNPIKIGGYVFIEGNSFEGIAQAIEEHGHCIITVGSNYNEWSSKPEVQGEVKWYHAVCAIDYVLYEGKKYLVIEDSWGSNIGEFDDRRLLSEEFIKARCTGAMYLLPYSPLNPDFSYVFTSPMSIGGRGVEVERLQKALQKLGFFPNIPTTQYFGEITRNAVNKFQMAYKDEILTPLGLTQPTGRFGTNTMKKLNSLL